MLAVTLLVGGAAAETTDLSRAVEQSLAQQSLTGAVSSYGISPTLVQLRRYVEPGHQVKLVCVIELALSNRQGAVLAKVRGSVATTGASRAETVNAAARAAVARLPLVLQALRERAPEQHVAQQ